MPAHPADRRPVIRNIDWTPAPISDNLKASLVFADPAFELLAENSNLELSIVLRLTLLGLPEDIGNQLARVLLDESHQVSRRLYVSDLSRGPNSCAVFISGDDPEYRDTLSLLRETHPELPVIVVTRHPETRHWLDALEAGASDYCGAPFEHVQLRWILGSVLSARTLPAAQLNIPAA